MVEMPQFGSVGAQVGSRVAPGRYSAACAASGATKKTLASARANERERERESKAHGSAYIVCQLKNTIGTRGHWMLIA